MQALRCTLATRWRVLQAFKNNHLSRLLCSYTATVTKVTSRLLSMYTLLRACCCPPSPLGQQALMRSKVRPAQSRGPAASEETQMQRQKTHQCANFLSKVCPWPAGYLGVYTVNLVWMFGEIRHVRS